MMTSAFARHTAHLLITSACVTSLISTTVPATAAEMFTVTTLVSDQTGASLQDPSLVNAWGISNSASSPFWVSDNGSGVTTVYNVNPATDATTKLGLTVTIPGAGSVTGQVFNPSSGAGAFNSDFFLFVSEDGAVSGWRNALGTTAETLALASPDNVYKGAAIGLVGGHTYLYAANFHTGTVDVFKGDTGAPDLAGRFLDPNLPSGYAPFNAQHLGNEILVAYAQQNPGSPDEVAGAGFGYVDAFDLSGNLIGRVASGGTLNAPWGLAIAPASWGTLAGDLLVGNFGDGTISAYDLVDLTSSRLQDATGQPLVIDGLWALAAGNGGSAGSADRIYFTAGPNDEAHGAFGVIAPVPLPAALSLLVTAFIGLAPSVRRRKYP